MMRVVHSLRHFPSWMNEVGKRLFTSAEITRNNSLRNIAIIAHVDHGKTTLVDALLSATGSQNSLIERSMDSNDLEKERGITILSKVTSVLYKNTTINIVDTPGHTDFSGEVERALSMVDGVCLVVDATDGPMAQTKYVLQKALALDLKPLVVINKVDRPTARIEAVKDEVLELFCTLECSDEQLDYDMIYASGKEGWASLEMDSIKENMFPLLDAIVATTPPPVISTADEFFRMSVKMMESDSSIHMGKVLLTGKVFSGTAKVNQKVKVLRPCESIEEPLESTILRIYKRDGITRRELQSCEAGDIVTVAGILGGRVADTICSPEVKECLPTTKLDPPTISALVSVNDSSFAGSKELSGGTKLTSQMIKDRLIQETESNIAIQIGPGDDEHDRDSICVFGRGEMQLGILFETMRREGFEISISPPRAVFRSDPESGELLEPVEEVTVITDEEFAGICIESLISRKAELLSSSISIEGRQIMVFIVPSRGMVGLRSELLRKCSGNAIVNSIFHAYMPYRGKIEKGRKGVMISTVDGLATAYALAALEPRGTLFISPGDKVYAGMIVGEHSRINDIEVNVAKEKKLTNVRASGKDDSIRLIPPREFQLEDCIGFVQEDELIEITPKAFRMRKAILDASRRKATIRKGKVA